MNCPFCSRYFSRKADCVMHVEKRHPEALVDTGLNAEQVIYQSTHGTIHGKCMCGCGRDTEWNYKTGKPYKVSPDPECKKRIAAIANARNMRVYGKEKVIDDPEMQKKMLESRKISSTYAFADGGKVKYTGKLEKNFLEFCDKILELESRMVLDTPEVFTYYDPKENRERFYIPDFYLPDYNLIIEIKPGGDHPNSNPAYIEETKYKESLKDEAMKKQGKYNYLKIVDKQYGALVETLFAIVHGTKTDVDKWNGSLVYLKESATNADMEQDFISETFDSFYVILGSDRITGTTRVVGITESSNMARIYVDSSEVTFNSPIFDECNISVYRFIGNSEIANGVIHEAISLAEYYPDINESTSGVHLGALRILNNAGIRYRFNDIITNTEYPIHEFVEVVPYERLV